MALTNGPRRLDDDLVVNLCTSEHLLVHHPMLEGILLSECERLRQRSLANKLISLFRQFGGTELRLKLVWLCWLDLMTGNSLDDWTENLKRKSEKELGEWIIDRQKQNAALADLMDQYVLWHTAQRLTITVTDAGCFRKGAAKYGNAAPGPACSPAERGRRHTEP